MTVMTVILY